KLDISREEMLARHKELAHAFGDQPEIAVQAARERANRLSQRGQAITARSAMTFAKDKNFEREAVVEERDLLRDALRRSMGDVTLREVRTEFDKRVSSGEFIEHGNRTGAPDRAFTTQEMIDLERKTIQMMHEGQNKYPALASNAQRTQVEKEHSHLSESQRRAVEQIVSSRDQVTALEGAAGAGKTTSLAAIREVAKREGFQVEGFAPTTRAAQKLAEAGIESSTLQRHLAQRERNSDGEK